MLHPAIKNGSFLLVALTFLFATSAKALARDAFNGTWKITVSPADDSPRNGAKEFADTLLFKGSKLQSDYCLKNLKLPATTYDEDTRGGIAATFKCEMKNEKEKSSAVWTGTSTASELSGELTITKPDGSEQKYTYKGERQQ
jgi:hypothetical protein